MAHQYTMEERLEQLAERRAKVECGGGEAKLEKQHTQGKLTARERVSALLDEGSFQETGAFRRNRTTTFGMDKADMPADGVITGSGSVLGRPVHIASQDFTVMGGSAGEAHSIKVTEALKASLMTGTPFVFINDSGGARVQEASTRCPATARCSTPTCSSRARCRRSRSSPARAPVARPTRPR